MNCTLCKDYQAFINNVPKEKGKTNHCPGCQIRNKNCLIKKGCPKLRKKQIRSCHQCTEMPCKTLERLDRRYREHYNMSMVENLKQIREKGIDSFLKEQEIRHKCPKCGGVISVHNKKCYSCSFVSN